jgi:hypothetical protein
MDKEKDESCGHGCCCGGKGLLFGIALLIIGLLFLAKDMGYIAGISFWTILFLVGGVFLVLGGKKCGCK